MKPLAVCCAASILAACNTAPSRREVPAAAPRVKDPIVVLFVIDGVDRNTALTAAANGAGTLAGPLRQGVTVESFYCTSPAPRMVLPDGSLPWGTTTSANVAMHTGCHVFESRKMDDIFLSARRAGIVSVFAGGAGNYSVFDTASHLYYGNLSDEEVVERGLEHFRKDGARLIRLHLQRIRSSWSGPADTRNPGSAYIQYFVKTVDPLLGKVKAALESAGAWERTYVILASDHGMGQSSSSDHPPSILSSWQGFLALYGPGIRRGATIAYAESPDVAVMANHFLGLPPLKGYLEENVPRYLRAPTGTLLEHILEGGPKNVEHPRLIERYLVSNSPPGDSFGEYREGILKLLAR
ncbi:MAG: alkaline phosphatase family protein [Bryobacterales bacterium]|nr:alkaline phosphatase family protein [Bryobacterales bacterium]